jgi:hypothetical protein
MVRFQISIFVMGRSRILPSSTAWELTLRALLRRGVLFEGFPLRGSFRSRRLAPTFQAADPAPADPVGALAVMVMLYQSRRVIVTPELFIADDLIGVEQGPGFQMR